MLLITGLGGYGAVTSAKADVDVIGKNRHVSSWRQHLPKDRLDSFCRKCPAFIFDTRIVHLLKRSLFVRLH